MSHDIYKNNFAGVTPGWHRIGVPLQAGTTAEKAMELAGQANWSVRAVPLGDLLPIGHALDTKGMHLIVRADGDQLVIASDQLVERNYTPISNEDVFGPMVEMLAGESLPVDCAGVLGRLGNRAFMTFNAGNTEVAGSEKYQRYIVAIAPHTGRDASHILSTAIRVVCANTERAAKATAEAARTMLTFAHNKPIMDAFYNNVDTARNIIGLADRYQQNLEQMADEMQLVRFDGPMFAETVRQFRGSLGKPETKREETIRENAVKAFKEACTLEMRRSQALEHPFYSLWTAKQAVSTYVQHTSRGGEVMRAKRSMKLAEGFEPPMMTHLNKIVGNVVTSMHRGDQEQVSKALQWMGA